jgi:hypothetical protein
VRRASSLALLALAAAACAPGDRPWEAKSFSWEGELPEGQWVRVRNLNGAVKVSASDGDRVEIRAEKSWRGGRPEPVRFVMDTTESGVVVCALWGKGGGECSESRYRSNQNSSWWKRFLYRRKSVNVEFVVAVPRGVKIDAQTVNGSVKVDDAPDEVRVSTVNGAITASTSRGPIRATTVNGAIKTTIESLDGEGDIELKTVNGSVTAELPADLGGTLDLSTVNGRLDTEFPVTLEGAMNSRRIRGVIGDGSRRIKIGTVNGSVTLRKGPSAGGRAEP